MANRTPILKETELDGYRVKIHAATYRQFQRAATAENQMEGTATLCDEVAEIEGETLPASELLTIKGVNAVVSVAIGTSDDEKGVDPNF